MTGSRAILSSIGLIVITLVGCVSLSTSPEGVLSGRGTESLLLPAGYEVEASLHLSKKSGEENYILAMSNSGRAFSAAFLTPQGIPVSRLSATDGKVHISKQTEIGALLQPLQLLEYLALAYGNKKDIESALSAGWSMKSGAQERVYDRDTPGSSPVTINLVYLGTESPFPSVTLTDSRSRLKLTIHILEANRVLPE